MEFNISRFKNIEKQTYDCEVITPMFLSGANQSEAELRTQSIKGALRFWWRALYGRNYELNEMKEEESKIFGNTMIKSKVSIKIDKLLNNNVKKNLPKGKTFLVKSTKMFKPKNLGIIDYLAYGLHDYDKGINIYNRPFIEPNSNFNISIIADKKHIIEVKNSFFALFNYGGLGAKSRNGFGSINCKNINNFNISEFFKGELRDYTAFNAFSWIKNFNEQNSWESALSEVGLKYREARLSLESKHSFDRRGLVAKPIEARGEKIPHEIRSGRQSKIYFMHVNKINNKYIGQILFLPYIGNSDFDNVNKAMKNKIMGGN